MSFHHPYIMAINRIYLCVGPCCRQLFGLGICAGDNISCACKYRRSSHTFRHLIFGGIADFPSVSVFAVQNSRILLLTLCSGLLLSRTWVFTGRKKFIAWVFSILLLSYFGSNLWADINFMELYMGPHYKPSPEVCLQRLTVAKHKIGVGVDNRILCISSEHNYLSSLFK